MRRVLLPILALVVVTGCGQNNSSPSPNPSAPAAEQTSPAGASSASSSGRPGAPSSSSSTPSSVPLSSLDPGAPQAAGTFSFAHHETGAGSSAIIHVTLSVQSVQSTSTGTRMTFWLNSGDAGSAEKLLTPKQPELYPTLTDPRTRRIYRVTTWSSAHGTYCVCSDGSFLTRSTVKPMDAAYATLPDDVSQVVVSLPGETGSVTIPVTR